jgi:two-component system response regulator
MNTGSAILLVEDNRDDELLTLRALKRNNIGNEVVIARQGEEALDFLFGTGAHAGRDPRILPQLILLDLNLPKMSGLDVLRKIRAEELTRLAPVVVLTSSQEDEDILNSYALGANAYVRKPVDFGQFIEAMKTLGIFWLLLNHSPSKPPAS